MPGHKESVPVYHCKSVASPRKMWLIILYFFETFYGCVCVLLVSRFKVPKTLKDLPKKAKAICIPTVIPHSLKTDAHCTQLNLRGLLGSFAFALSNEAFSGLNMK